MTETVYLVLGDRPFNNLCESNRENTSYDKLKDKEMDGLEGILIQFWQVVDIALFCPPTTSSVDSINGFLW